MSALTPSARTGDVVIVGGGVIGMLSARELALAGLRVTLLERGATGRESTWAGGGILSPLYPWRYPDPVNHLALWSQGVYPALAETLRTATGIDPEWTRNGLLILDPGEAEAALAWARGSGARLGAPFPGGGGNPAPGRGARPRARPAPR